MICKPFKTFGEILKEKDESLTKEKIEEIITLTQERIWNGEDPCDILKELDVELPEQAANQITQWWC